MSDLAILFPEPEVIEVGGRRVEIRPVKLCDFDAFGKAAGGLFELLSAGSVDQIGAYAQKHGKELGGVLARCTSLTRWRAKRLPASVAVQVLVQVVRVNAGFFGAAQAAMATALAGQMLHTG